MSIGKRLPVRTTFYAFESIASHILYSGSIGLITMVTGCFKPERIIKLLDVHPRFWDDG